MTERGEFLWRPRGDWRTTSRLGHYLTWLETEMDLSFPGGYEDLWRWSVSDLDGFWRSVWDYFEPVSTTPVDRALASAEMPGARWFPGTRVNYAEHALRAQPEGPAIVARSQSRPPMELSIEDLRAQVGRCRAGLERLGVGRGDRVAGYLPNIPETVVAFLATASLGAVWSSCAPESGTRNVVDRLRQIEPSVLLAVDGYAFGPKRIDRHVEVAAIRAALPYKAVGPDLLLSSISGGTDVCSAFVGGCPLVPVRAGEISCRYLGAKVEAYDGNGTSVVDEEGELVLTAPMPSMPVGFWRDEDGSKYRAAYFERHTGVWTPGDWITLYGDGASVISGRSDATPNRGGVRMGTAELYSVVEVLPEVADSLVVHLEDPEGGPGRLVLFVVPAAGTQVDDSLRHRITDALRNELSPRHLPDEIHQVPGVPRTLSGKKLELPE